MKTPIPTVALVLAALGSSQAAQPGFLALQAETKVMSMDDLNGSGNALSPAVASNRLGLRFSPIEKLGIDVLAGFSRMEGHPADTPTKTSEANLSGFYSLEAGLAWTVSKGEHASLAILGRGAFALYQTQTSGSYIDTTANRFEVTEKVYGCNMVIPSVFVGVEPSVALSPNFQLYSTIGLRLAMIPDSKGTTTADNFTVPNLVTKKDGGLAMGLSGLSLGMRYVF